MNKNQSNQFRMFLSTQSFLDTNASVWNGIPRLVNYKNMFDEIISRIHAKTETTKLDVGVTQKKDLLKENIASKTSMLSGILQIIATEANDMDLVKAIKMTKSDLLKLKESDVDSTVKNITTKATEHLEILTEFGVTQDVITELLTSVQDYNVLIGKPRTILSQRFAALSNIEELFDEGNTVLKLKMDNAMVIFRELQAEFYKGYQSARTIIDN